MMNNTTNGIKKDTTNIVDHEDEDHVVLPGFRFHPTDEELVGFYLHRKVEKKPISIELIKQIDIYKFDPWDLPKTTSNVGSEKQENYFYCKRGRKYRNSIRPNRVTGSGFWKATGIDKPVYSSSSSACNNNNHIGLKKTLVYYIGFAGKGTKTDWMMHEFRLPLPNIAKKNTISPTKPPTPPSLEAEVWTLCRIFKRNNISHRKHNPMLNKGYKYNKTCTNGNGSTTGISGGYYSSSTSDEEVLLSFGGRHDIDDDDHKISSNNFNIIAQPATSTSSTTAALWKNNYHDHHDEYEFGVNDGGGDYFFSYRELDVYMDELRSVIEFA